ncbi:NAD(P)/FAD-dependent oxidoreductase [Mycobacterium branderi]|uniref:Amino acid dehydrogenase n=1 Tax=Mycobacterium branderi TaxID=43348 RepID=A0A7I7W928_9MYCO|nr:FAD-binding oxidoreductase [Mycobacterium branderi]MCV7232134.1 FAD-binding oxidoreductase [Mycobacterium branderi]ORA33851.1 amino acid dehydrogenase [Mycobacterium branderi]BBZ14149.1 D-amino-acid dehydrogenase [Mycobacterium branderi]
MAGVEQIDGGPRSAIVVGAGIVGLSTAWFLQDRGIEVTVADRTGVAAGASWGNAGWVAPGLICPLNSPGLLRHGLRALRDPVNPLQIPSAGDAGFGSFLAHFAAHCRRSSWKRALRANVALNEECIEAFDVLIGNGVDAPVTDAPITAVFPTANEAQQMLWQQRQLEKAGQTMYVTALSGEALREQVPLAAPAVTAALNINAQRFVDPRRFVEALGRAVVARGAVMQRLEIRDVLSTATGVAVYPHRGKPLTADVAVIATGARLAQLANRWLRIPVQAGHGYSFRVPVDRPLTGPIYLPGARVMCTPHRGAMRVSGITQFHHPRDPFASARVEAVVTAAAPLLDGVRWAERSDLWVGACAFTPDGRPLIGEVSAGVYVAGGHGMWGLAHGPVTGRLLAEHISTGKQPEPFAEFDPLRRSGH